MTTKILEDEQRSILIWLFELSQLLDISDCPYMVSNRLQSL